MTDTLTATVTSSLQAVAARRQELNSSIAAAQDERDLLDRLEQWLHDYPGPVAAKETPADRPEQAAAPKPQPGDGARPAGTGARAKAPASPSRPPARPGARDLEAKVLSLLINEKRAFSRQEIQDRTGSTKMTCVRAIRALVDAGKLVAEGQTRTRRYRSSGDHEPHTERRARMDAATAANRKRLDDAVARVGLRDRVFNAIAADPDCLTEERLANALGAHPDDIAEACNWLRDRQGIQRNDDGTHRRIANKPGRIARH